MMPFLFTEYIKPAFELAQLDETDDRFDALTKAKKLSLETNKRRRVQAHKRKLEAQREERRRQEILSKRREEQKLATEKYQRSHIPPSARQGSGRLSPKHQVFLDDALRLIRGNHRDRPKSAIISPRNENEIIKERSNFENTWHHPIFGLPGKTFQNVERNIPTTELKDSSLRNLTNSKTLFEQQLEHQQQLLLEQHQQSLRDFNHAIQREIESNKKKVHGLNSNNDENTITDNDVDSYSSMDSIDDFSQEDKASMLSSQQQTINGRIGQEHGMSEVKSNSNEQQQHFFLHDPPANTAAGSSTFRVTHDMTASALYETKPPVNVAQKAEIVSVKLADPPAVPQSYHPYMGPTADDIIKGQANGKPFLASSQSMINDSGKIAALKQFSTDSLESVSSISSISQKDTCSSKATELNRQVDLGDQNNTNALSQVSKEERSSVLPSHENITAWTAPDSLSQSNVTNRNDPYVNSFQPRYASVIGSTLWSGQSSHQSQPTSHAKIESGNTNSKSTVSSASHMTADYFDVVSHNHSTSHLKTESVNSNSTATFFSASPIKANYFDAISQPVEPVISGIVISNYSAGGSSGDNKNNSLASEPNQSFAYHLQNHSLEPQGEKQVSLFGHQQPSRFIGESSGAHKKGSVLENHLNTSEFLQPQPPAKQKIFSASDRIEKPESVSHPSEQKTWHPSPHTYNKASSSESPHAPTTKMVSFNDSLVTGGNEKALNAPSGYPGKNKAAIIKNNELENLDSTSLKSEEQTSKIEEELDEIRPVKGILKPSPVNTTIDPAGLNSAVKPHPRDSLELARFQQDKKMKKKSVRFADHHLEETEYDLAYHDFPPMQKISRPASAKVVSVSIKNESVTKVPRAASTGTVWQTPDESAQLQIRNVQQLEDVSAYPADNSRQQEASSVAVNSRSNLPPSFTMPLNTTTPAANRPRAAAHIIMSSEAYHQKRVTLDELNAASGPQSATSAGAVAHKSNLEAKVKSVNNNFMSKVPVKVPASSNTNTIIFHAAYSGNDFDQNGNKSNHISAGIMEGDGQQSGQELQYNDRSKIRDNTNRRVAISSQTVIRTSIVPTSTKITYPQTASTLPSYSANAGNNGTIAPVYDENGLRIDRTPTDEEITWLWDKVRSCLQKEDSGNKNQIGGSSNSDPGQRPPPSLSTKLIDGTSLNFAPGKNAIMTKNGSGFFHPHTVPAINNQAKARPVIVQQGSYLKRFGLLKQRRTNSANAIGSSSAQTNQRVNSAVYNRQPTIQPTVSNGQPYQPDGPTSIAFTYKPQDAVSESTAAFVMAERLAKQSLSDSHIQLAMDDAKSKQEAYNRSKLLAGRDGPSMLSIEEQRLMESLDRLNEKLHVGYWKLHSSSGWQVRHTVLTQDTAEGSVCEDQTTDPPVQINRRNYKLIHLIVIN
ncbi:hypothetical protein Btru_075489 [Bulinus truncatus]|nr:hypothetical protein Btru_075489 [Bulinus truncatus]